VFSPHFPLNSCDVMVSSFWPFADLERPFVWEKSHGFRDLNTRIAPDSGRRLESASSVNGHIEIVGWGDHKGEDDTAGQETAVAEKLIIVDRVRPL
jgi:hypothetical protein